MGKLSMENKFNQNNINWKNLKRNQFNKNNINSKKCREKIQWKQISGQKNFNSQMC